MSKTAAKLEVIEFRIIRKEGKFAAIHPNTEQHFVRSNVHQCRLLIQEWVEAWKLKKHDYTIIVPGNIQAKKA